MRKTFTFVLGLLLSASLLAGIRSQEAAAELAAATLTQSSPALRAPIRAQALKLAYIAPKQDAAEPAFYAFNHENGGFAVISADDRTADILCYSTTGRLDTATMNPSLKWWLSRFAAEISSMSDEESYEAPERVTVTAISPLLGSITWDQGTPYNNLCPIDIADNTRCYTGCVATAAAQIMRYWQHPTQGTGSKTYTWTNYDPDSYNSRTGTYSTVLQTVQLSANFGATTYDWTNMKNSYASGYTTAQANAVATLMYHCGVACEMEYGGDAMGGSGALTDNMGNGMVSYFGYQYTRYMDQYSDPSITTSQLSTAFNSDLEAGRPILMGGYDEESGGHEFVCDGRDSNGRFHINWGWEGDGNCYTTLSSMKPSGMNHHFSSYIDAIIGLEPVNSTPPTPPTPGEETYATCAEANTAATGDTVRLNEVTVTVVNGAYTYLRDASGGTLLYGASSLNLQAGDVVSGLVAKATKYNNLPELTAISTRSSLTVTSGNTPEPIVTTTAPSAAIVNQYVRYEGLAITGTLTSTSKTSLTATMPNGTQITIYNQFKVPYTFSASERYAMNCVVSVYGSQWQVYPLSFEPMQLPTALEETETTATQPRKVIENGHIYILHDGVRYSVLGNKID